MRTQGHKPHQDNWRSAGETPLPEPHHPERIFFQRKTAMKHSVGIFSRSDKRDYSWLVTLLSSSDFSDCIQDVRSTVISNSGFQQFIDDASQCSLGILYHTKNRGRVNITDISGSLYDDELDNLNQLLGRDNVIVVVDDVEDSSHEEKIRILESQPTIRKLASDLLLITKTEKNNSKTSMTKLRTLMPFNSSSALQGSSTYGGPDPRSGGHNLEEKLTDTNKTNHGPLRGDKGPNTKSSYEILKPWISSKSPEVSFRDEGPPIWKDYDCFKSIRKSSIPMGSGEEFEIPLSNKQFCNIYYESQKIPLSTENVETWPSWETENIYEDPDSWINDKPKPKIKPKRKSTIWYSSKYSEMLPDNESQEDEFCGKTSNIGIDCEISEKPPSKGYPTYRMNKETSRIRYGSESSKKPPIDEFSGIYLYNKPEIGFTYKSSGSNPRCERSEELCDKSTGSSPRCERTEELCDKSSGSSPRCERSEELCDKSTGSSPRCERSEELCDKSTGSSPRCERSEELCDKSTGSSPRCERTEELCDKSFGSSPRCERSEELCDNSDSMCEGESRDTPLRKMSPKAQKSPNSQSIGPNFSDVIDELKRKQNKIRNLPH
ncbi:uncharacterized protein LOC120942580 isoform X2 [Rana temporaria]|uniref:uncharacterized protein LOC120942580 isoform X2 n=1 Tax=Rana temporaria TaxID=8407 RepID=UPI001AAD5D23|nr:uncharacterized protein LOC120942580 isoform X2 [Rana temporaria]